MLLCLVAAPCLLVRGDTWAYTATFTLSGGGALEGAPTITSNPTPNYAQNISLPAAAANQNVIITFVLPRQSLNNTLLSPFQRIA
jgi:hypothetical protein